MVFIFWTYCTCKYIVITKQTYHFFLTSNLFYSLIQEIYEDPHNSSTLLRKGKKKKDQVPPCFLILLMLQRQQHIFCCTYLKYYNKYKTTRQITRSLLYFVVYIQSTKNRSVLPIRIYIYALCLPIYAVLLFPQSFKHPIILAFATLPYCKFTSLHILNLLQNSILLTIYIGFNSSSIKLLDSL